MVAPLTSGLAAMMLAVLAPACSGATEQDVFQAPSSAGSGGNTSGGNTSGGNTSGGTTTTSGGTTSGGGVDASAPETSTAACTAEAEPNDARDEANALAPSRCGVIQPNSESDFLTFQLSPKSTSMQLKFEGQVTLRVEVDGGSVTLGAGKFPPVPFVKGKRYFVEVKSAARATSVPWRVNLIEN